MRINGKKLSPNVVTLVLPRGEGEDIVIRAQAVLNFDDFDKILPRPEPPIKVMRGGEHRPDFEAPEYLKHMQEYGTARTRFMILQSLRATEGLEWDKVKLSDPNSWNEWEKELEEAGFSDVEKQRIMNTVMEANALNEAKIEEARERFLLGKSRPSLLDNSTSQSIEHKNI